MTQPRESDLMVEFREAQARMEEAYKANRAVAESDPTWAEFEEARDAYLAVLARARDEVPE